MPALSRGAAAQEDEDTEVREEGTACHWAAHQLSMGQPVSVGMMAPNGVQIDAEMLDACAVYFDAVRAWGVPAYFELPVICKRVSEYCGGTADVGTYCPDRKTIFVGDLKYGFRFVDVIRNWQLLCYFVGLQHHFGILSDVDLWVEFLIVQPRSYHRDGPVRRWRVHATELRALINILANAADGALQPLPMCKVNAGCNRCGGRHQCETLRQAGLNALDWSLDATPHGLPFVAAEDELRRLQRARDIIDARLTGLEGEVMHGMRNGQASRHFAIEASTGRKVWNEASTGIVRNMATLYGVNIVKEQLITPTQAEKVLPVALIAQHSFRPQGAAKLVPIEASRIGRKLGK